jgi:nicotinate-nucleotide adenylyltransferase
VAHVLGVSYLLSTEAVDLILIIPVFLHPFAKELAPFEDRMAMCERAMGWLPKTNISRVEEELGGESRTLRTVEHLHTLHPDWRMRLVVGSDILLEGRRWYGFEQVVALAPLLVLGRVGSFAAGSPPPVLPEVSSTAIRDALRTGRRDAVTALVPREVLSYIDEHRIYREGA